MNVNSLRGTKRKRSNAPQDQPEGLGSSIVMSRSPVKNVLVVDVGGTSVKILATRQTEKSLVPIRTDAHSGTDGGGSKEVCGGLDV